MVMGNDILNKLDKKKEETGKRRMLWFTNEQNDRVENIIQLSNGKLNMSSAVRLALVLLEEELLKDQ